MEPVYIIVEHNLDRIRLGKIVVNGYERQSSSGDVCVRIDVARSNRITYAQAQSIAVQYLDISGICESAGPDHGCGDYVIECTDSSSGGGVVVVYVVEARSAPGQRSIADIVDTLEQHFLSSYTGDRLAAVLVDSVYTRREHWRLDTASGAFGPDYRIYVACMQAREASRYCIMVHMRVWRNSSWFYFEASVSNPADGDVSREELRSIAAQFAIAQGFLGTQQCMQTFNSYAQYTNFLCGLRQLVSPQYAIAGSVTPITRGGSPGAGSEHAFRCTIRSSSIKRPGAHSGDAQCFIVPLYPLNQ